VRLELVLPGASSMDGAPLSPNDNPLPHPSPRPHPRWESAVAWPRPRPASCFPSNAAVTRSASYNTIVPSTGVRLTGIAFHDQHVGVAESNCYWCFRLLLAAKGTNARAGNWGQIGSGRSRRRNPGILWCRCSSSHSDHK
jgi:hypothetical protein